MIVTCLLKYYPQTDKYRTVRFCLLLSIFHNLSNNTNNCALTFKIFCMNCSSLFKIPINTLVFRHVLDEISVILVML